MNHTAGWILGVAALALAGAGARADLLEDAKESGKVTVGIANEAPYGYQTPEGELTGEAPEIAKHVLGEMGIEDVEAVITEFGSLIPGLKAGRFDLVAAGMFVTPERCQQVAFSEPTYGIGQAFLVAEGNPEGLQTYDDIKANPEATLAVMAGAIERTYARDAGVPDDQVMVVPDPSSGAAAVQAGRADAFALTSLSIRRLADGTAGVEVAQPFGEVAGQSVLGHGAFAFRPEDDAFRQEFNRHLADFIGSEEHLALVEPFGFTKDELPQKTTEELCAEM
ncbi:MAG TPA: ectoine/hydroxyectoine ABC transporter substrate-binding protein EhuB [Geminicoccaceae bacterium]|nr:ectoine/hydroxyectoine ABC transporter substrate-binding protein EhuB [Geminicoccaceae bacterium]